MSTEFHAPWKTYDILEMDRYELGPEVIYIAQDRTCVFVKQGSDLTGLSFRRADENEITDLWQKHRLIALLPVFQRMVYLNAAGANLSSAGQFPQP